MGVAQQSVSGDLTKNGIFAEIGKEIAEKLAVAQHTVSVDLSQNGIFAEIAKDLGHSGKIAVLSVALNCLRVDRSLISLDVKNGIFAEIHKDLSAGCFRGYQLPSRRKQRDEATG